MNAPDHAKALQGIEALSELARLTREPLPASRKVYVQGSHEGVRVPMREVSLTNGEAVTLYDCSGPYTDPNVTIDVTKGLPPVREAAVVARGDTELYEGRRIQAVDDGLKEGERHDERMAALRAAAAGLQRTPRRQSRSQCHADALRPPGHRHARDGVRGPAREPAPHRTAG